MGGAEVVYGLNSGKTSVHVCKVTTKKRVHMHVYSAIDLLKIVQQLIVSSKIINFSSSSRILFFLDFCANFKNTADTMQDSLECTGLV